MRRPDHFKPIPLEKVSLPGRYDWKESIARDDEIASKALAGCYGMTQKEAFQLIYLVYSMSDGPYEAIKAYAQRGSKGLNKLLEGLYEGFAAQRAWAIKVAAHPYYQTIVEKEITEDELRKSLIDHGATLDAFYYDGEVPDTRELGKDMEIWYLEGGSVLERVIEALRGDVVQMLGDYIDSWRTMTALLRKLVHEGKGDAVSESIEKVFSMVCAKFIERGLEVPSDHQHRIAARGMVGDYLITPVHQILRECAVLTSIDSRVYTMGRAAGIAPLDVDSFTEFEDLLHDVREKGVSDSELDAFYRVLEAEDKKRALQAISETPEVMEICKRLKKYGVNYSIAGSFIVERGHYTWSWGDGRVLDTVLELLHRKDADLVAATLCKEAGPHFESINLHSVITEFIGHPNAELLIKDYIDYTLSHHHSHALVILRLAKEGVTNDVLKNARAQLSSFSTEDAARLLECEENSLLRHMNQIQRSSEKVVEFFDPKGNWFDSIAKQHPEILEILPQGELLRNLKSLWRFRHKDLFQDVIRVLHQLKDTPGFSAIEKNQNIFEHLVYIVEANDLSDMDRFIEASNRSPEALLELIEGEQQDIPVARLGWEPLMFGRSELNLAGVTRIVLCGGQFSEARLEAIAAAAGQRSVEHFDRFHRRKVFNSLDAGVLIVWATRADSSEDTTRIRYACSQAGATYVEYQGGDLAHFISQLQHASYDSAPRNESVDATKDAPVNVYEIEFDPKFTAWLDEQTKEDQQYINRRIDELSKRGVLGKPRPVFVDRQYVGLELRAFTPSKSFRLFITKSGDQITFLNGFKKDGNLQSQNRAIEAAFQVHS